MSILESLEAVFLNTLCFVAAIFVVISILYKTNPTIMAFVDDIKSALTRAEAAEAALKSVIQQKNATIASQQTQITDLQTQVANAIPVEDQTDIFNRTTALAVALEADQAVS